MAAEKDHPDIIGLPPVLFAVWFAAGWLLTWILPGFLPGGTAQAILGGALAVAGIAMGLWGILAFRRAGTNIEPIKPALVVVTSGPYRFTRNPMYIGILLMHAGLALILSVDWALLTLLALAPTLHYGVVLREEAYLTAKFGSAYTDLLARTRRWV